MQEDESYLVYRITMQVEDEYFKKGTYLQQSTNLNPHFATYLRCRHAYFRQFASYNLVAFA